VVETVDSHGPIVGARRFIRWRSHLAPWHPDCVLSQAEIDSFAADGYVAVRGAEPADVLRLCQDEIWSALGEHGVRRDDPSTWREPVVRISCPESEAFAAAGSQPVLWEAFDQLIGEGRWWRRRGVGGSIPVRFPSQADPGDAGWHIEGSFEVGGDWWVNYRSRARGLLALYLFSDVDAASAPTRVRPTERATGQAGDVIVCHPFLVHAASWPHTGRHPRIMAQPGVALHDAFPLVPPLSPVELAM
jgi:hypothetical protein